jgi:hypothetical protein
MFYSYELNDIDDNIIIYYLINHNINNTIKYELIKTIYTIDFSKIINIKKTK